MVISEIPPSAVVSIGDTPEPASRPRARGRPKGSLKKPRPSSSTSDDREGVGVSQNQLIVLPQDLQEPNGIMTRARRALLMGQRMGMSYNCSEEEALRSIDAQIHLRRS